MAVYQPCSYSVVASVRSQAHTCPLIPPIKDILLILQRMMEHFASGCSSLQQTRPMHASRIVVSAAIAAVADVVLRQSATDGVSAVTLHLVVRSYGKDIMLYKAGKGDGGWGMGLIWK